jgi:hypothetical protein
MDGDHDEKLARRRDGWMGALAKLRDAGVKCATFDQIGGELLSVEFFPLVPVLHTSAPAPESTDGDAIAALRHLEGVLRPRSNGQG